jgi:hypothetical protein
LPEAFGVEESAFVSCCFVIAADVGALGMSVFKKVSRAFAAVFMAATIFDGVPAGTVPGWAWAAAVRSAAISAALTADGSLLSNSVAASDAPLARSSPNAMQAVAYAIRAGLVSRALQTATTPDAAVAIVSSVAAVAESCPGVQAMDVKHITQTIKREIWN